jgi:hypothetical protein
MRLLAVAVVLGVGTVAVAGPKAPEWFKRPDDKYRCTRYAPGVGPDDGLRVYAPPGKPMMFSIAATRGARYRADGLPPGATLDARSGVFSWKIPADATGKWNVKLVAENAGGAISSPLTIEIASTEIVAAWKAGMGGFEPDCSTRIRGFEMRDVDGDGAADLVYTTGDDKDDSANSGSFIVHVQRRVGDHFDGVDRTLPWGSIDTTVTPAGATAIVTESSCCCRHELSIHQITAKGVEELLDAVGEDCRNYQAVELERDKAGRITRVTTRGGDDEAHPVEVHWHWTGKRYERAD